MLDQMFHKSSCKWEICEFNIWQQSFIAEFHGSVSLIFLLNWFSLSLIYGIFAVGLRFKLDMKYPRTCL